MQGDERRNRLLELVRTKGFASLPELASALHVSESTVRRDLENLEEQGSARRTHGGVYYTGPSPKLPHFDQIQAKNWEKKKRIAEYASRLIDDGDTILLDGGSTTYELAQLLVGRSLQVVTNSFPVANLFLHVETADLIFVGGFVHSRTGVSLGPYANQILAEINCRKAVLSVGGIHDEGCYNSNLLLVETERAMMRAADEVIVVADSTKFGRKSLARLCDLEEIDVLVVDNEIDSEWKKKVVSAGVKLHIVSDQ